MNDFLKEIEAEVIGEVIGASQVHVRVQQRSARKRLTIIENLSDDIDIKGLLKRMRKKFSCTGSLQKDKKSGGTIIQLTGDQRKAIKLFLVDELRIVNARDLILHG